MTPGSYPDPAIVLLSALDEAAERGWVERIEQGGSFDYVLTPEGTEALHCGLRGEVA